MTESSMPSEPKKTWPVSIWLVLVLGFGVAARFWFSTLGHNTDFESCRIVTDILAHGKNVYANTIRYNYGPVWFNIMHVLDVLAGHDTTIFRWLLVGVLSAADVGIFLILWRKIGRLAATLFFLNPVSILITGYHNQFDNIAILFGLCSVLLYGDDFEKPLNRRKFLGLLVLGLSLMTKHILFVFPVWLAVKQRGLFQKCLVLLIPPVIFLAGFLPYWSVGHAGIVTNVFYYRGAAVVGAFFYSQLVPEMFQFSGGATVYWILTLVFFAFLCRKKNGLESLLVYLIVMLAASPALANQYLAIPIASVSVFINPFFIAYTALSTLHICVVQTGLDMIKQSGGCAECAVGCLFAGLLWLFWRAPIVRFIENCVQEIARQFISKE